MSWRTILITQRSKLSYRNNYLLVKSEVDNIIHLSEVNSIIVDSTQVTVTTFLLSELMRRKIKLVLCDDHHNPQGEVIPYYGAHNSSKKIGQQMNWSEQRRQEVWTEVVRAKIINQAKLCKFSGDSASDLLLQYATQIAPADTTNREGHAAKVYFNALFGLSFTREQESHINAALNYGYAILLSAFNREIVSRGYLTQIGINHRNEFNPFNLTSDLMEPYRILVDRLVYLQGDRVFDQEYRQLLIQLLSEKVRVGNAEYFLTNAMPIYLDSVFEALESEGEVALINYEL